MCVFYSNKIRWSRVFVFYKAVHFWACSWYPVNEMSDFIQNKEFLDQVEDYQIPTQIPTIKFVIWILFFVNCKDSGFGGLEVACWPLVPKFGGSHPAEAGQKSSARLPS